MARSSFRRSGRNAWIPAGNNIVSTGDGTVRRDEDMEGVAAECQCPVCRCPTVHGQDAHEKTETGRVEPPVSARKVSFWRKAPAQRSPTSKQLSICRHISLAYLETSLVNHSDLKGKGTGAYRRRVSLWERLASPFRGQRRGNKHRCRWSNE